MIIHPSLRLWKPLLYADQADRSLLNSNFTETSITYSPALFGSSSGIHGNSTTNVITNKPFSCSVMLQRTANLTTDYCYVVNNRSNVSGSENGFAILVRNSTNSHRISVHRGYDASLSDWHTTYTLPLNTPVRITVVVDTTSTSLYINNTFHSSEPRVPGQLAHTVEVLIGKSIQNGQHFLGNIWDLHFYNFALNITDISRIRAGLHPLRR